MSFSWLEMGILREESLPWNPLHWGPTHKVKYIGDVKNLWWKWTNIHYSLEYQVKYKCIIRFNMLLVFPSPVQPDRNLLFYLCIICFVLLYKILMAAHIKNSSGWHTTMKPHNHKIINHNFFEKPTTSASVTSMGCPTTNSRFGYPHSKSKKQVGCASSHWLIEVRKFIQLMSFFSLTISLSCFRSPDMALKTWQCLMGPWGSAGKTVCVYLCVYMWSFSFLHCGGGTGGPEIPSHHTVLLLNAN